MTSLRGPDPYASVEDALAARGALAAAAVCELLHTTIPTYTWVAVIKQGCPGAQIDCQRGQPHSADRQTSLPIALFGAEATIVADVAAAPTWRAAFPKARALIAVPAGPGRALVATSEHQGAFGPADRALLESIGPRLPQ